MKTSFSDPGGNGDPQANARRTPGREPAGGDTPTLGIATLLDIFDGDADSVTTIFVGAMASIDADFARIAHGAQARDMDEVAEAAHRMKGTSGTIRSQRVLAASASIQLAAQSQLLTIGTPLLDALREAVAELRRDLEAYRRDVTTAVPPSSAGRPALG